MNRMSFPGNASCSVALVAAAMLMFTLIPAADAAVLLTGTGTNTNLRNNGSANFGGTIGYSFTVDTAGLTVTALGVYDAPGNDTTANVGTVGDGLEDVAPVTLYSEDGTTILASVTVPVGTGGTLIDGFRYVDLGTAVSLTAGETYVLAMGVDSGGNGFLNRSTVGGTDDATFSSDFTYDAEWYTTSGGSSGTAFPTSSSGWAAFAGPNLQYIPEPASCVLLGLGGLVMAGRGRRR